MMMPCADLIVSVFDVVVLLAEEEPELLFEPDVARGAETEFVALAAVVEEERVPVALASFCDAEVAVVVSEAEAEADEEEDEGSSAGTKGFALLPPVPWVKSRVKVPSSLC